MRLAIVLACYDSGHHRSGFGLGPEALVSAGLVDHLSAHGHDLLVQDIGQVGDAQEREIATGFAVCKAVAAEVRSACDDGRFPIVLGGNCLTAAGAVAGDGADSIVWFDQHGDINTPETSSFGFLDGMSLSSVLGLCWRPMTAAIPGFQAIDPARCVLVDARDLDPGERLLLDQLPISRVPCDKAIEQASALTVDGASRTHLHLDLDVHDPSTLRANKYATPGGPSPDQARTAVCGIARSMPLAGMTITAYDPTFDPDKKIPAAVKSLLVGFVAALEQR
jgi:arginase